MYIEEKPPLEELVHSGVLGMKWGVHQLRRGSARAERLADKQDSRKHHITAKVYRSLGKGQEKLITSPMERRLRAAEKSKHTSYESVRKQGILNTKWNDIDPRRKKVMLAKGMMASAAVIATIGLRALRNYERATIG